MNQSFELSSLDLAVDIIQVVYMLKAHGFCNAFSLGIDHQKDC
jgi:hypothetical protein